MNKNIALVEAKNEINRQLGDKETFGTLLATTFKGLEAGVVKRAILEGYTRGFTFKDFLEKNIYAIPYGKGYSLVTSIDYSRKIGARSGVIGKSAPQYTLDTNGKIESCSITVHKKGGHPDGYTATVYFEEYTTGRNLWVSKPRTMISKVAEMHALRMACPEELSQTYVEEEMVKEADQVNSFDHSEVEDDAIVISTGDDTPGLGEDEKQEILAAESRTCADCGVEITKAEEGYSLDVYGKKLCRTCQRSNTKKK